MRGRFTDKEAPPERLSVDKWFGRRRSEIREMMKINFSMTNDTCMMGKKLCRPQRFGENEKRTKTHGWY